MFFVWIGGQFFLPEPEYYITGHASATIQCNLAVHIETMRPHPPKIKVYKLFIIKRLTVSHFCVIVLNRK